VFVVVGVVLVVVVGPLSSPQPANKDALKVRLKASFFRSIPISPSDPLAQGSGGICHRQRVRAA
jgi:hypothetical protein